MNLPSTILVFFVPHRSEIHRLIEWLDTGLPPEGPDDVSVHSVAETLLLFLDSLRVPVIPDDFYRACLEVAENEVACRGLVSKLPQHHKEVHMKSYLLCPLLGVI